MRNMPLLVAFVTIFSIHLGLLTFFYFGCGGNGGGSSLGVGESIKVDCGGAGIRSSLAGRLLERSECLLGGRGNGGGG